MKIKGIVKQILKEELDDFTWINDYGINPEKMSDDDILLLRIRNQLKGKKSYLNRDYVVGEEADYYFIAEMDEQGNLSFFDYLYKHEFNLNHIEKDLRHSGESSSPSGKEYKKLYDDLKPLFVV
jgi:hypothetical protein